MSNVSIDSIKIYYLLLIIILIMNNFLGNLMHRASFDKNTGNPSDVTLTFESMPIKTDNVLDQYVKGLNISGQSVGT